jgi:NADH-quinone oxidoreductase subunit N
MPGGGESLEDYRGLGQRQPFASGVLTLALLALAGIPPTAGFTGKFLIFAAALRAGEVTLAVIGILLAAISIYYYLRVVVVLYFKETKQEDHPRPHPLEYLVLTLAATTILLLGIWPGSLLALLAPLLS